MDKEKVATPSTPGGRTTKSAFAWLITLSRTAWHAEHISVVRSKESKSPCCKSKTDGPCSFKKLLFFSPYTLLIDINPQNDIVFHYPTLSFNSDKILALRSLSRSLKKSTPAVTFRRCAALVFRGSPFLYCLLRPISGSSSIVWRARKRYR